MKYRVLRFFADEPEHQTLIGHYDTKRLADDAIRDDIYKRQRRVSGLEYSVEPVETELTQSEIDEMLRLARGRRGDNDRGKGNDH